MSGRALMSRWFGGAKAKWAVGAALLAAAGGVTLLSLQRPAKAATLYYTLTYKAVTKALDGTKVPFTATGTATLDTVTGECSYFAEVPELQASISGTGTLGIGTKFSYGLGSFNGDGYSGSAIFSGKFNDDLSRFKGTIVVAIPNQFGPSPAGFTYTEGRITLIQTTPL